MANPDSMDIDYHVGSMTLGKRRRDEQPSTTPPSAENGLGPSAPTPTEANSLALVLYNPHSATLPPGTESEADETHTAKKAKLSFNFSSAAPFPPRPAIAPPEPEPSPNPNSTLSLSGIDDPAITGLGIGPKPILQEPEQELPRRRPGRPRKSSTASSATAQSTDTERAGTPTEQIYRRSSRLSSKGGSMASINSEVERRAAIKKGKQKAYEDPDADTDADVEADGDDSSASTTQMPSSKASKKPRSRSVNLPARSRSQGKVKGNGAKRGKQKGKTLEAIDEEDEGSWEEEDEEFGQFGEQEEQEEDEIEDVDSQHYAPQKKQSKKKSKASRRHRKPKWERQYTQQRSSSPVTVRLEEQVQGQIMGCFSMVGAQVEALGMEIIGRMQEFEDRQRTYREADRNHMESQLDNIQQIINQELRSVGTSLAQTGTARAKRVRPSKLPDAIRNNPNKPFFLVYLRDFIDRILLKLPLDAADDTMGMDAADVENTYRNAGIGKLLLKVRPLTEEEYDAFHAQRLDAPKLNRQSFRFDFTVKMTDGFNKQALHTATRLFKQAIEGGEYNRTLRNGAPLPNAFLEPAALQAMIESHVEYLFRMYEEAASDSPDAARVARLERTNKNTKKNKLFKQRAETLSFFAHLRVHAPLLESIGTKGMSEDEEEFIEVEGVHRVRYHKVRPDWRGHMLSAFLQQLDPYTSMIKRSKIGRKGQAPGGRPRIREASNKTYKGLPPTGLPLNCYDRAWYQKLLPFERDALKAVERRYNFAIPTVAEYKSNPEAYAQEPSSASSKAPNPQASTSTSSQARAGKSSTNDSASTARTSTSSGRSSQARAGPSSAGGRSSNAHASRSSGEASS